MLAEKLGYTVRDLRRRLTHQEFIEWVAFWTWRNREEERARKRASRK